jgi:hypothetical protein
VLFAAGAVLILVTLALPWTVVESFAGGSRPFLGYQEDLLAAVALVATLPTIRMLYVAWYEAPARFFAAFTLIVLFIGVTAATIDIRGDGLAHGRPPVFLVGYYLGWLAVAVFAAGTVLAFRVPED